MKNSIRQMVRTPARTALFFLLLTLGALLLTLGAVLWIRNERTASSYEEQFVTIGTVSQKANSFGQTLVWDAAKKDYTIIRSAQYDSYLGVEALDIPGVKYLAGPEQRAYYGSWAPEYVTSSQADQAVSNSVIAEFTPLEDGVPGDSLQIKITRVLGGDGAMENSTAFFCDHENPEPERLRQDKTYVARISYSYFQAHGKAYEEAKASSPMLEGRLEYVPLSLSSQLYHPDGSRIEDEFQDGQTIFEVTEGFYETDAGKRILDLAKTEGYTFHTQPVTGTNKTCLLPAFYQGESYLAEGRDISEEEYREGSKVCLAPRSFMENNGLALGDTVTTRLFYTNTRRNAGMDFMLDGGGAAYEIIDEEGKGLEPFEVSEYTVVGIYETRNGVGNYTQRSGRDELIVPMNSIKAGTEHNLVSCGPMTDATTSFQIENGAMEEFQKLWARYGQENLEITFQDMGYSKLQAGIRNMRNLSLFFLIAGVMATLLLLLFFAHLFIAKQSMRTAVERSLGMSPSQCRWSLLSGILLLICLGSTAGGAGGVLLSGNLSSDQAGTAYYDSTFSVGASKQEEDSPAQAESGTKAGEYWMGAVCILLTAAGGTLIAVLEMNRSLAREPMELLSRGREE